MISQALQCGPEVPSARRQDSWHSHCWGPGGKRPWWNGNPPGAACPLCRCTSGAPAASGRPESPRALLSWLLWHSLREPRNHLEAGGEGEVEPGQRSGSQSGSIRIAAQILELQAPGQRKRRTQGFRGPQQAVSPREPGRGAPCALDLLIHP